MKKWVLLMSSFGSGKGRDTITSGMRCLDREPDAWDNELHDLLFGYEWVLTKSPLNSHLARDRTKEEDMAPDAEDNCH